MEDLPMSSVAITPANYKFRYLGEVGTADTSVYVFQIVPKQKHYGLIQGKIWIDSVTGAYVLEAGYLVKTPSAFTGRIEVVRDTKLLAGYPYGRVTHVTVQTRQAGRGELTITELPLIPAGAEAEPKFNGAAGVPRLQLQRQ